MDLQVLKEKYVPGFGDKTYFNGYNEINPIFNEMKNVKLITKEKTVNNEWSLQAIKWIDAAQKIENDLLLLKLKITDQSTFEGSLECLPANTIRSPQYM
jgi:hypothetical protein